MKKHVLILAVLMGLGFFSCAKGGNEKKVQVLKVAFNQVAEHPQYIALDHFGKELEKQTNGAYKLEISPNAVLGDQRATAELVQNGTIQMAIVANPIVESFNKDFAILGLTYVYDGLDHLAKVIQSNILDDLYMSTENSGFIINAAFSGGARNVYTDRPLHSMSKCTSIDFDRSSKS